MLANKSALVVADDAHSLLAICSILRDLGICYKRNTTGVKVVEQVRAMTPPPDFILLDIDLASGDAFGIYQRLQSDPVTCTIPVIAIGSMPDYARSQRIRRADFSAFVLKPLPRQRFADLVERALSGEHVWEATT